MGLNTTQMRMLKKQVDESFKHLKEAVQRKQKHLIEQIELAVGEEYTTLPIDLADQYDALVEDAKALSQRADAFHHELRSKGWVARNNSQGYGVTEVVKVKISSVDSWRRFKADEEIKRRKLDLDERVSEALFTIERDRLTLNQEVLENNIDDAGQVLARVPSLDQLLPTPEYVQIDDK